MRANVDEKSNMRHKQSSSTFSFGIKEIKTELLDIAQDETETNYHKVIYNVLKFFKTVIFFCIINNYYYL
jgi:hypothetical protein